MISSTLLLFGLASIFLHMTRCENDMNSENVPTIEPKQTPFRIILGSSKSDRLFCGGTLINNNYVLTAAECVVHRRPDEINAYTAVMNLDKDDISLNMRRIRKILIHEEYTASKSWRHDIALLRLGVYILPKTIETDFQPWSNKSSLPQKGVDQLLRQHSLLLKLFGYGIISETRLPGSFKLRESFTYIVNWESCKNMYKQIQYTITDSHICAYDPLRYEKLRTSDVGSALIYNETIIVGIALSSSGGILCPGYYYPILFTNVTHYRDWILEILNRSEEHHYGTE